MEITDDIDNIKEIVKGIFSEPPKQPNSIQLYLEEETSVIANIDGVDDFVFNILCLITIGGIEYLFGHKNILELTESQFEYIQEYANSYGYRIVLHTNGFNCTPWELKRQSIPLVNYRISFERY
jgi:hypothetical protein